MKSHRLLGGGFVVALLAAGFTGLALPAAAQAAYNQVVFSARPANGSLSNGATFALCVQAEASGVVQTGESIDLSIATGQDIPTGDTGSGGSATATDTNGTLALTSSPQAFLADETCQAQNGSMIPNAVTITYTSPDNVGGSNSGAPFPVWGGRDIITGTNPAASQYTNDAIYEFSPVTTYVFSVGATIATAGSLAAGHNVPMTVEAENASSAPVVDASVLLSLAPAASGGSAQASGGAPPAGTACTSGNMLTLTATPTRCVSGTGGTVSISYTTSSSSAAAGEDIITAQSHPTQFFSSATSYTYQAPGVYTALQPFRICDTRQGTGTECSGTSGNAALGQGQTMTFHVTGVLGPQSQEVPSGAQAAVVNVTAVAGSAATDLTVFPAGSAVPTASNLNVVAGINQANLVVVRLGSGGELSVYNAVGSINVVVDVEGYFAAPSGSAGRYHSIPPLRICDSRSGGDTACSGSPLGPNQWTKLTVSGCPTGDPSCTASVPSDGTAAAVALNLTAVDGTAATNLSVVPSSVSDACPSTPPVFSNVNVNAGTNLPNRVIVPLGPNQDICVYNLQGSINYIVDVNGWFGTGAETSPGALFYAAPPTRICDTRSGTGTECSGRPVGPGQTLTVMVAGSDGFPPATGSNPPIAVIANVTAVSGTMATDFTLYPADVSLPTASDLNVNAGQNTPNLVIVQLATTGPDAGAVDLYNLQGSIDAIVDVAGWFQLPPP
jgi:hypothetical protein